MTTPINLLTSPSLNTVNNKTNANSVASVQKSFTSMLGDALNKVNASENTSTNAVNQMMSGKADNLHNVMIAMEKSEITLKLAVEVRDKVVNAYQEIMRMQV